MFAGGLPVLAACSAPKGGGLAAPAVVVAPHTPTAVSTLTPPTATAAPTSLPATATSLPSPTAAPTAVPLTPTPAPPLVLALAPEWETAVAPLISQLNRPSQPWQLLVTDDPAAALADGRARLALSESEGGTLVYQEPVALALPFTTEWEATSLADARAILADGHRLVVPTLWSAMTPDLKALRVDGARPLDPAYPLQKRLALAAAPGTDTAVAQLLPLLQAELAPPPMIHLAAVGDIMLARGLGYNLSQGHLAYPFAKVADELQAADITLGNVESALGSVGEPAPKSYPFQAPPEAAQALALGGFDVVSLANNHGMDYGPEALLQALALLRAQNVQPVGAGANRAEAHTPYIAEINGLKIAFLAYVNVPVEALTAFDVATWDAGENSPGLAWGEPEIVAADVTAVRPQVDLVVVILHSGYEYIEEPSEPQALISRAAIDAGAHLVIGHHAHILQGIERYNGGVIVYGLGNFAFEIDGDPSTAILHIWLDQEGVHQLELVPAIIQFGGQPRLAEAWETAPILQKVYYLTRLLNGR